MKKKGFLIFSIIGVILVATGITVLLLSSSKKGHTSNKKDTKLYSYTEAVGKSLGLVSSGDEQSFTQETMQEIQKELSSKIYKLTLTGSFTEGESGFTNLNGTVYVGQNQFYFNTSVNSNDKLYNLEALFDDDKLYFYVKDVISKYYYIENLSDLVGGSEDSKLVKKVVEYLIDSFTEVINDNDVKIEDSSVTINDKEYNTKKYSYTFTGDTLYNIISTFASKIKNDPEILKEINKILKDNGVTSEYGDVELNQSDFEMIIDQLVEYAEEVKSLGNLLTYSVHMYKDDVISRQLSINIPSEQGTMPVKIADYTISENGMSYYKIAVSVMGTEYGKIEVRQITDSESIISVSIMGEEVIKGEITKTSNGIEIVLRSADDENDGKIEIKINNDGTGSLIAEGNDTRAKFEYKIEEVDSIPKVDLSNSAPYTEMTEADKKALEEFLNSFNVFGKSYALDKHNEIAVSDCYFEADGTRVCGYDM